MLLPATPGFTISGFEPVPPERVAPRVTPAPAREDPHGTPGGPPHVRLLGGYFVFDSPGAGLLVSLLPAAVHVRGEERLSTLVRLVGEEAASRRTGRELLPTRPVEVLLAEALRSTADDDAPLGLLRGLADAQLAPAILRMNDEIDRVWTCGRWPSSPGSRRSRGR